MTALAWSEIIDGFGGVYEAPKMGSMGCGQTNIVRKRSYNLTTHTAFVLWSIAMSHYSCAVSGKQGNKSLQLN